MFVKIILLFFSFNLVASSLKKEEKMSEFYTIPVVILDESSLDLKQYQDKVVLVVNIASKCGFTKQLKGLQSLSDKYKEKGLEIIGFPSNDFFQEPLKKDDIGKFCLKNYGVNFKIAKKTSVKGKDKHPMYQFFEKSGASSVKWNFYKYLIDKKGKVVESYSSFSKPEGGSLEKEIKKLLGEK